MMQVYPTPGTSFSQSASTSDGIRYQNIDYTNPPAQGLVPRTQWLQFPGPRPGAPYGAPSNNWPPYELWNVSSTNNSDPSQAQRIILAPPQGQDAQQSTLYRIQDILSQGQGHLPGEVAKTPGFQEKSPTGATIYFQENRNGLQDANSYRRKDGQTFGSDQVYTNPIVFDPSRPQQSQSTGQIVQNQYKSSEDPGAKSPSEKTGLNTSLQPLPEGEPGLPKVSDIERAAADRKNMGKRGRVTFSGCQVEELEKAFNQSQYLSTSDRHVLADRLSLTENQIKIWFQNRRTKCRRTAWKRPGSGSSSAPTTPTTPNPPVTPTTPITPGSLILSPTSMTQSMMPDVGGLRPGLPNMTSSAVQQPTVAE